MKKPDLKPRKMRLDLDYVNSILGVSLGPEEVKELLEKMRYGVKESGKKITVFVPAYRTDVLHPMDIVEDIAIAYGYENFVPELPEANTVGERHQLSRFASAVRELMLGLGFSEVMTLILTNEDMLFTKMNIPKEDVVTTKNPVSIENSVARSWLLPSLMFVLEKNKNREYPQKIFEVGYCISPEGKDSLKVAGVTAHSKASFSEIKAIVSCILESLGCSEKADALEHGSFISGRCASTYAGFFGEIHPQVLENFGLEMPAAAFELDLKKIASYSEDSE